VRPARVFRTIVLCALAAAPAACGPRATPEDQQGHVYRGTPDAGSIEPIGTPDYAVEPYPGPVPAYGVEPYQPPPDAGAGPATEYAVPMPDEPVALYSVPNPDPGPVAYYGAPLSDDE